MRLSIIDRQIISSFTSAEKQAIYQVLCAAVKIDGKVDDREMQVLSEIVDTLQITEGEIINSRIHQDSSFSVLQNMPDIKKPYVMKFVALICLADGQADPKEVAFVSWLAQEIKAPSI